MGGGAVSCHTSCHFAPALRLAFRPLLLVQPHLVPPLAGVVKDPDLIVASGTCLDFYHGATVELLEGTGAGISSLEIVV